MNEAKQPCPLHCCMLEKLMGVFLGVGSVAVHGSLHTYLLLKSLTYVLGSLRICSLLVVVAVGEKRALLGTP